MECRKYIFFGRVQGVGFRATTAQLAQQFSVSGTVKNLSDGSVELIVCGKKEEIERFLQAIQSHYQGHLEQLLEENYNTFPKSTGFRILH